MVATETRKYWAKVRSKGLEAAATLAKGEGKQPEYDPYKVVELENGKTEDMNECYLTSLDHTASDTRPGVVVSASVHLASQRLASQTHRLSTDEEITDYLAAVAKRKAQIQFRVRQKRTQYTEVTQAQATPR